MCPQIKVYGGRLTRRVAKAIGVLVTNIFTNTEGGSWDGNTHQAVRYLLNKVGYTKEQAEKVDPDRIIFRVLHREISKQGMFFDSEEDFGEFLEAFRAYALIEQTFNDKTPLDERGAFQ